VNLKLALSPDEARKALGLGRTTIYNLLTSGKLRAVKVNRRLIVPVSEIERSLSESGTPAKTK
jgi:excisionase family DNA binding protein